MNLERMEEDIELEDTRAHESVHVDPRAQQNHDELVALETKNVPMLMM